MLPRTHITILCAALALASCSNDPYRPGETGRSTYFYSYNTPPSKLDPTSAYYTHEGRIIDQVYEPPFTYHYLKRPYELIPLTAESIPAPVYFDRKGRVIRDPDPPAEKVARAVASGDCDRGIMIDSIGIASAIAANKIRGIRATPCWDVTTARSSREHNNANVLTLGGKILEETLAKEIVSAWLATEFAGGRHWPRVNKIMALERTSP